MNDNLDNNPAIDPVNAPVTNNGVSAPSVDQPEPISLGQASSPITLDAAPQSEPAANPVNTLEQPNNVTPPLDALQPQMANPTVPETINNDLASQPSPVPVGIGGDVNSGATPTVTPQPIEANMSDVSQTASEDKPKKGKFGLILIIIIFLMIGAGLYVFFGTDLLKKKSHNAVQKVPDQTVAINKFEGIYKNNEDKLYIHNVDENTIYYNLGGNFNGQAKIEGNVAKQIDSATSDEYLEFKLVDSNIEVTYHSNDNSEIAAETGTYTRVSDYSKDNIYKEAVGDPSLLSSKYSGLYASGDVKLYMIQVSDTKVLAKLSNESDVSVLFDEEFEIIGDNKLIAKSPFDEDENAFEITFDDKSFSLTANEEVFGFDEDNKLLELTYTFDKAITAEEILTEFYTEY